MAIVCRSCDRLPPAGIPEGAPCAGCGTPLVRVEADPQFGAGLDLPDVAKLDDAAFGPPPQPKLSLELDPAWVAERAAKQAAAARPPKRSYRNVVGLIVALVLIAVVAVIVVRIVQHDGPRAKPARRHG